MTVNYRAVRAFNRLWAPIAEALEVGAACDRGFDGGEWSDSASANTWQREFLALVDRVARRFGLRAQELENALEEAHHTEWRCFQESFTPALLRKQA